LLAAANGRPIDILLANAGRGLGRAFIDQDVNDWRRVIDTNVTGTTYLLQKVAQQMAQRNEGKILITGSIAGLMPGAFQAVYNGTKAYLDSFSYALREELRDTNITVTVLMPGPTETEFFERGDLMDTKVGTQEKDDPAKVAQDGWDALMSGAGHVVSGWKNKLQAAMSHVTPDSVLAKMHANLAEPGTAK
jgi:short-subunit dehydrogenase